MGAELEADEDPGLEILKFIVGLLGGERLGKTAQGGLVGREGDAARAAGRGLEPVEAWAKDDGDLSVSKESRSGYDEGSEGLLRCHNSE